MGDRRPAFTTRARVTPGGTNTNDRFQIWVRNLTTTDTYLVSGLNTDPNTGERIDPAPLGSPRAMVSGKGQHVVFESAADTFPGDDTATTDDVWICDVDTFALERMSENLTTGTGGNGRSDGPPAISQYGRYVAFVTASTNLVDVDPTYDQVVCAGIRPRGGLENIVVLDRGASNLAVGGVPTNTPHIEWVSHGLDITGTPPTQLITCTQPDGPSSEPSISAGGCKVAYLSEATNLTNPPVPQADPNNPIDQVYFYNRNTGYNHLVSQSTGGVTANGNCSNPKISADGRFVVFVSDAANLVAGDSNGLNDVFVRDLINDTTTRISVAATGQQWTAPGFTRPLGFRFPKILGNRPRHRDSGLRRNALCAASVAAHARPAVRGQRLVRGALPLSIHPSRDGPAVLRPRHALQRAVLDARSDLDRRHRDRADRRPRGLRASLRSVARSRTRKASVR